MRHRKDGRQFSRDSPHRRAMFRNLAGNLITHERIVTTDAKAKELRRVTDKLITKAKRLGPAAHTPQAELNDEQKAKRLHVSRQLEKFLPRHGVDSEGEKHNLVEKVMIQLSKRFADRPGGYTRIIKLGQRKGDGAHMSIIEFVDASAPAPKYEEAAIGDSSDDEAAADAPAADAPAAEEAEEAEEAKETEEAEVSEEEDKEDE
jgi:large subunit ribosomal protein L17